MDIFFDTTVLVAASEQSHPHYAQARPALLRVVAGRDKGFMGLHSIAEVFAALTHLLVLPVASIRWKQRASSPITSCRILRSYPSAKRTIWRH